jgi:hypothetical protein
MRLFPIALLLFSVACGSTKTYQAPMPLQPVGENDFDLAVRTDSTHLTITVSFRANMYLANVRQYGFTVFVDGDPELKRSLGIHYPTGRSSYPDDPMFDRMRPIAAKLAYRSSSKTPVEFVEMSTDRLSSQGVVVRYDESTSLLRVEYSVPLRPSRVHPYAVDAKDGEVMLGFEIKPPILEAASGMDPYRSGQDRTGMGTTRTPYGSVNRDDELTQSMRRQLLGEYVKWVRIKL